MENKKLDFFTINNDYIEYLWQIDKNVMLNHRNSSVSRPYVGVVLEFENFLYFIPLTHNGLKWQNYFDHVILNGGKLGALKVNKMIPVAKTHKGQLIKLIVRSVYTRSSNINMKKYGFLLANQYREINLSKNLNLIYKKALYVYSNYSKSNKYICNFKLLEKYAILWTQKYLAILYIINSYITK